MPRASSGASGAWYSRKVGVVSVPAASAGTAAGPPRARAAVRTSKRGRRPRAFRRDKATAESGGRDGQVFDADRAVPAHRPRLPSLLVARILVVEHESGCPLDRLGDWLAAAPGVDLDVRRPWTGEALPDRLEHDGLIVLGGTMGANDDDRYPWLTPTKALLTAGVRERVPTLGICLGAQLLAVACGGRVEVGAAGIEAGVVDAAWRPEAADDPLLGGLPDPYPGPSMHQDAIVELPRGATWLAATAAYPHQAFCVGDRAWGVQFHPEVGVSTFRGWADGLAHSWQRFGLDGDEVVAELVRRDVEVAAAGRALADRFVSLVGNHRPRPSPGSACSPTAGAGSLP